MIAHRCCFAALLLACLVSCASDDALPVSWVGSGSLAKAVSGARTISLHPRGQIVRPRPGEDAASVEAQIEEAIEEAIGEAFERRGYRIVPVGQGDRVLAYAVGVSDAMSDAELVATFGMSPGLDTLDDSHRAAIIFALFPPGMRPVLWRRSVSVEVGESALDPEARAQSLRDAVDGLLDELPDPGTRLTR